ncbi:amidase [Kwoniella heveanensis BCC8398]|uniref:amidase n=1 Tax=Kwoniella heveanensis BCC8398 TaxID=1296120 RepID=A0A1B9H1J6_9TREE|nr:amidase [Kwoniella heveanensis BCC8398]
MTVPITAKWEDIASAKRAARDALIPEEWRIPDTAERNVINVPKKCGVLTPKELEITETEASVLVDRMIGGQLTSYEVTLAFCKRAAIAQQLTNCLTEIFFDAALLTAQAIDKTFASTGTPVGPLHGLPVSLKDNFYVEGVDTTVGFVGWANDAAPKEKESEMTKIMRQCGAVLFCKTNVPTAMMMAETYNNTWNYTTNPYNRDCSSGGSSGGESALLALKGSPLGVGTDIGGSIRIPASFCGLYSLKPSFGRFATYGARSGLPGQEAIRSINGPMSSSLSAVQLWSKAVVDTGKPWTVDPNMLPIPWREVEVPEKLCFGMILDNGIVKPTPPVTRALLETKKALEAAGHTVIEWCPYNPAEAGELMMNFFLGDGGVKIAQYLALSGEPYPAGMGSYKERFETHKANPPMVGSLWDTQSARTSYCKKVLDDWLSTKEITGTGRPFDALLSPVTAYSACPKYAFDFHVTYTSMWNITDYSCTTLPVTYVDPAKDVKGPFEGRSELEQRIWDRYDPKEVEGAPVSIQVVCGRLEEEKVLKITGVVDAALKSAQ